MSVNLVRANEETVARWVFGQSELGLTEVEQAQFRAYFISATELWLGFNGADLVCVWGLAAPTLLSDVAYLWLYTTPALKGNEFLFVRHSQRAVEDMLLRYSRIEGHTTGGEDTMRWLRWLGAEFGRPQGKFIPFWIRKRSDG